MTSVAVNGTTLYYERRGEGPPILFISWATGDAGHWTEVADALTDEFTVLTYDRRGNSRSPRPEGWSAAPIDEQADDAAELLRALDLTPAVAYGNSSGALILTSLALRHPEVLRGAIQHVMSYLPTTEQLSRIQLPCVVASGVDHRDPTAAHHWFYEASRWFAGQLGATFVETPGGHVPQATHPQALAEVLRPLLRKPESQLRADRR